MVISIAMVVARRCLSLSFELDSALLILSIQRRQSISAVVEMLLREHALVRREIELVRMERDLPAVMAASGKRVRRKPAAKVAAAHASP
jgi:hypothetical protein